MSEFKGLAELERFMGRVFHGQEESICEDCVDFTAWVVLGMFSVSVWNFVM